MVELTDKEWALYEERYGKLMHTIAMKISGDDAIASHEDNYADLCIAALESIEGFEKKTGEKFESAINNKLFDQYTKTVLWNRKAKKGIPLTKKMEFRNKHYSLDSASMNLENGEHGQGSHELIEDNKASFGLSAIELDDFAESQPDDVKKVINAIMKNPGILSKEGIYNQSVIRKATGLSVHFTSKAINHLKDSLRKTYEV
tara:strand:+ start:1295 stop:1900 length:606 start_codon:yes stop_codon:yes gene_type:complete